MSPEPRRALITGATGAIGEAIAWGLAAEDFEVILACRNQDKAERTLQRLKKQVPGAKGRWEIVDVSEPRSIAALIRRVPEPLQVLVNNAATAPPRRQENSLGIELQLATNVLGYLWIAEGLKDQLAKAGSARVVNVASYWAGGLNIDDLEFRSRRYENGAAYPSPSKPTACSAWLWPDVGHSREFRSMPATPATFPPHCLTISGLEVMSPPRKEPARPLSWPPAETWRA